MIQSIMDFFSIAGFMPHGHCYLWKPSLLWTMVTSDALIGISYLSISMCLYFLIQKIQLPFNWVFLAFGVFIAACGATHFMEIYTLWRPEYWLSAFVKGVTAIASVTTAILLYPLFPKIILIHRETKLSEERRIQLERITQELTKQSTHLTCANKELESFSGSVSHDLRAPLRSMAGFSKILLEDYSNKVLDEKGIRYLHKITNSANKMGELIDGLLSFSQYTRRELNTQTVNISKVVQDILVEFQIADPLRKVRFQVEPNLMLQADFQLIQIALQNLLGNAWKFTSKKEAAEIEFGMMEKNGLKSFFLRDNGAGFDMQYVGKLFGVFQRLHSEKDFEGTGIGLATVQRIILRHGGKIWVESELDKGTTFYFSF